MSSWGGGCTVREALGDRSGEEEREKIFLFRKKGSENRRKKKSKKLK